VRWRGRSSCVWVINRRLSSNRQLLFALPFDVDASVVLVGRDLDRGPQELRAPIEGPARDVDHAVHGPAHERVALLELKKSNRGSPWTAISRFNSRSRVLMVGRPSAPSLDSSTRLSLALRRRSAGSL